MCSFRIQHEALSALTCVCVYVYKLQSTKQCKTMSLKSGCSESVTPLSPHFWIQIPLSMKYGYKRDSGQKECWGGRMQCTFGVFCPVLVVFNQLCLKAWQVWNNCRDMSEQSSTFDLSNLIQDLFLCGFPYMVQVNSNHWDKVVSFTSATRGEHRPCYNDIHGHDNLQPLFTYKTENGRNLVINPSWHRWFVR